jgi:hypothetical protein
MNVPSHWERESATEEELRWSPTAIATHWLLVGGAKIGVVFESSDGVKAGRWGGNAVVSSVRSVEEGKRLVEDMVGAKGRR